MLHTIQVLFYVFMPPIYAIERENACILILVRNSELSGILSSIKDLERSFNKKYQYPYVFLNDDDFTDHFKEEINKNISSSAKFGKLTEEQWGAPSWIDKSRMTDTLVNFKSRGIIYGDSVSYRNMCRFFSGYFYRHELVKDYDYYWRIEPEVNFFCQMHYDPFKFMKDNDIKYGFVILIREFMETIPSLWETTIEFLEENRDKLRNNAMMEFILNESKEYNGCHFWSNFEIGSFEFFRSEMYQRYFDFLDKKGGFYYERWGDAPVHSLAATLFLKKNQIHHFNDIGYKHSIYTYCPDSPSRLIDCTCKKSDSYEIKCPYASCLNDFRKETL